LALFGQRSLHARLEPHRHRLQHEFHLIRVRRNGFESSRSVRAIFSAACLALAEDLGRRRLVS